MLTPDGRVKLTDFGIAKDLDPTALTATGRKLIYDRLFLSPEVVTSKETSNGLDPYNRCPGAFVRWRRILGTPSRSLVGLR